MSIEALHGNSDNEESIEFMTRLSSVRWRHERLLVVGHEPHRYLNQTISLAKLD
jgi:hypothetical protein